MRLEILIAIKSEYGTLREFMHKYLGNVSWVST